MELMQPTPAPIETQPISQIAQQITATAEGISILIPMGVIQKAFQEHMTSILTDKGSYNNPIKKVVDELLSTYSSNPNKELILAFKSLIETQMKSYMSTPGFHLQLGQAMAEEMAKKAVEKLNGN